MPKPQLIFLYGECVPHCTHHIDKQYIGYQTIQYMSAGGVDLWIGQRHFAMHGQWFWSAYPGPRIRFHTAEGYRHWFHRYVAFQGPLVKLWERDGLFPISPRKLDAAMDFGPRFDQLLNYSRRPDRHGIRRAVHLLEGVLIELAGESDEPGQRAPWIDRATEVLSAAATIQSPDYAELAGKLGVSESTLRRRFRQATGTSPHAYLLQRRISEARRMLAESDVPIKSIAQQLGYSDVYFFSRQFNQLCGVPPATYRRTRQG
jgi:AraC-like DNA-binding protein